MSLKKRMAINISIAFSILFGLASTIIYQSFADFRKNEFNQRLRDKALTTTKLLVEVKEVDNQLLKLIDKNSINKLFNEKILVFDQNYQLLYSSIDDAKINWSMADLQLLKQNKALYRVEKEKEVLGIFYDFEKNDYLVLISAEDIYGKSKLDFLLYSLIITYIVISLLVWSFTYYFISRLLRPLDEFQKQITNISANKLNIQLPEVNKNEEINLLTSAFNTLLQRLESAFRSQREFTASASHEIRTPLTRIAFQVENLIQNFRHSEEVRKYLQNIRNDTYHLSDLINSLLLLSKIDKEAKKFDTVLIDEIIFSAYEQVKKSEENFSLDFEIIEDTPFEVSLEIKGIRSLLEIVFVNLFKNAHVYSTQEQTHLYLSQVAPNFIEIRIINHGETISEEDQKKLFTPFMKASNATNKGGLGLGLMICKRILDFHHAQFRYSAISPNKNLFSIIFNN